MNHIRITLDNLHIEASLRIENKIYVENSGRNYEKSHN